VKKNLKKKVDTLADRLAAPEDRKVYKGCTVVFMRTNAFRENAFVHTNDGKKIFFGKFNPESTIRGCIGFPNGEGYNIYIDDFVGMAADAGLLSDAEYEEFSGALAKLESERRKEGELLDLEEKARRYGYRLVREKK
jgi:AMMECR1 domain-containing protein